MTFFAQSGPYIFNAPASYAGSLLDIQRNGVSYASVASDNIFRARYGFFGVGGIRFAYSAVSNIDIADNVGWLALGAANDTVLSRKAAGVFSVSGAGGTGVGAISTVPSTVAGLPSAATSGAGARAFVTDALAPTFGATVVGGGAVNIPIYSDGSTWKVG